MSSGLFGGLFGKKDKNTPQTPAPPAPKPVPVAPPPAPKLQPGLTPVPARTNIGAATTQPMVLPKSGGLKPAKPSLISGGKSTQRIVLPGRTSDGATAMPLGSVPAGNLSLPLAMIVRLLPDSVRAISLQEFETSSNVDQEISLPMALILPQLPSGKVEVAVQDLVAVIPRNYIRSQEEIAPYMATPVPLPLMDVVMRIPPDLLALRPDQKEVDSAVVNMADPFTEELLREQAQEAARKAEEQKQAQAAAQMPPPPPPPARKPETTVLPSSPVPVDESAESLASTAPTVVLPHRPTIAPASGTGPRPASISLPRPPSATLPEEPASNESPVAAEPQKASATPAEEPAAPQNGLTDEMKKLLEAAEAQLSESPSQPETPSVAPAPEPVAEVIPETIPDATPEVVDAPVAVTPPPAVPQPPPPPPMPRPVAAIPPPPAPRPTPAVTAPISAPASAPLPPPPMPRPVASTPPPPPRPTPAVTAPISAPASAPLPPPPMPRPVASTPPPPPPRPTPAVTAPISAPVSAPPPPAMARPVAPTLPPTPAVTAPISTTPTMTSPTPVSRVVATPPASTAPLAQTPEAPSITASAPSRTVDLNACTVEQLTASGCPKLLAEAIVRYRNNEGPFHRIEDLLKVPGITKATYVLLTGHEITAGDVLGTLNEVLGFPPEQDITLKDITERISHWPDIAGCVLGQASGLPLVGTVPHGLEKSAIMAFAPRLMAEVNASFKEFAGRETNELVIPTKGISYHIFRNGALYLVLLSRRRQLPRRFTKVARYVLSSIDTSKD